MADQVDPAWWSKIFGPEYLELYEPQLTPERTEADVEALVATLSLRPPLRILDIACGQGRHAIALAKRGFEVVGTDLSTFLLEVARTRTREAGLAVEYVHSDMRELPFTGEFDVAVNLFTAFGYFAEEEEHQRALSRFAQALRPGGRLVLEMINRDGLFGRFQPLAWQELPNGVLVLIRRWFDPHRGRIEVEQVLRRPGCDPQSLSHSLRLFPTEELVRLFQRAGLQDVALFEGFVPLPGSAFGPLHPYTPGSRRVCVTGRKPE